MASDDHGPIGSGDLWIPRLWSFLEVDGDIKYDGQAMTTLLEEKRRQERLEEAGFGVARVAARDSGNGALLLSRLTTAAARGRLVRTASGDPTGRIGPPPVWATRGATLPWLRPPE